MGCLKLTYRTDRAALKAAQGCLPKNGGTCAGAYRYGFNGMERENAVNEDGYDFGARLLNTWNGRWLAIDPKFARYPHMSPYNAFENNPIYFNDPTGEDAKITIQGNNIIVSTTIYIYGSGATAQKAESMQQNIMKKWGGDFSYKDPETGTVYGVKFNISVQMYSKQKNVNNIVELKMSDNTDNFVEVVAGSGSSFVRGERGTSTDWGGGLLATQRDMKTGLFYTHDRKGEARDASTHELGHLLGLSDRYYRIVDENGDIWSEAHPGHENSLMGNPYDGVVTQGMVNGVVGNAVKAYNSSLTGMWNNCSFCPGTATFDYHQQKKDHEPATEREKPQE
jgi:RHS repeat-associated protein